MVHSGKLVVVPQEALGTTKIPKIEMQTPTIRRIPTNEQWDWNFDMNAYMKRMQWKKLK